MDVLMDVLGGLQERVFFAVASHCREDRIKAHVQLGEDRDGSASVCGAIRVTISPSSS